jgi:hypothetical protein
LKTGIDNLQLATSAELSTSNGQNSSTALPNCLGPVKADRRCWLGSQRATTPSAKAQLVDDIEACGSRRWSDRAVCLVLNWLEKPLIMSLFIVDSFAA